MSDQYHVVLADLRSMAGTFDREHEEYVGLKPKVSPPTAATGDGHLDSTLAAVMAALSLMQDRMAANIQEHGEGLKKAGDSYERHDIDARFLFDDLVPEE